MSGLLQPSSFWVAARRLFSWRFLVAIGIMLCCFEGVARVAPWIVGKHVHQRYLFYERVCERECTNQGLSLSWVTNGRGARGALYHGEPVRIAVLGSSTTSNTLLDQDELWTEQLRTMLGPNVHVDNFARDGAADLESTTILRRLAAVGQHYDGVLIMTHIAVSDLERRQGPEAAFRFWRDWAPQGRLLEFPGMLKRRVHHQLDQEPRLKAAWDRMSGAAARRKNRPRNPLDPANRELRRQGKVRLVDHVLTLTPEEETEIRRRSRRLVEAAQAVGDRVWMIRQPVAYDENEVDGVADRWVSLVPVPGEPGVYLSNRSYAAGLRMWTGVLIDEARRSGAEIIDLDGAMRPFLAERADLFEDKWHFAPAGAEIAARMLADELAADPAFGGRGGTGARANAIAPGDRP